MLFGRDPVLAKPAGYANYGSVLRVRMVWPGGIVRHCDGHFCLLRPVSDLNEACRART
jgi:hypothetical protein